MVKGYPQSSLYKNSYNTIYMYSGITSGRVLNGELLYTKILEVNLFAFAYRLFRRDFSPLDYFFLQILTGTSVRNWNYLMPIKSLIIKIW